MQFVKFLEFIDLAVTFFEMLSNDYYAVAAVNVLRVKDHLSQLLRAVNVDCGFAKAH